MKIYLGNAFSGQMIQEDTLIRKVRVTSEEVAAAAELESCIGHPDTATVVSNILGREVACQRVSISLQKGDVLYVAQVMGGRLPEGCTQLPDGMEIVFDKYTIVEE